MEDLISRKRVLKAIKKLHVYGFTTLDEDKVIKTINNLPSATPKEKTGYSWTFILDKIRAELHATSEMHENGRYYLREEWIDEIIYKYKAESEEGK